MALGTKIKELRIGMKMSMRGLASSGRLHPNAYLEH